MADVSFTSFNSFSSFCFSKFGVLESLLVKRIKPRNSAFLVLVNAFSLFTQALNDWSSDSNESISSYS
jgi:hypothetical protein